PRPRRPPRRAARTGPPRRPRPRPRVPAAGPRATAPPARATPRPRAARRATAAAARPAARPRPTLSADLRHGRPPGSARGGRSHARRTDLSRERPAPGEAAPARFYRFERSIIMDRRQLLTTLGAAAAGLVAAGTPAKAQHEGHHRDKTH